VNDTAIVNATTASTYYVTVANGTQVRVMLMTKEISFVAALLGEIPAKRNFVTSDSHILRP
jgi:aconitase B